MHLLSVDPELSLTVVRPYAGIASNAPEFSKVASIHHDHLMVSHGELPAKKFNQVNTRSDQRVLEANNFRNRFTSFRSGSLTGFHGPSLSREQATHGLIQLLFT